MKYLTKAQSNAGGGGGERVLWTAIASMHRTEPDIVAVVYSGDTEVKASYYGLVQHI
jgi:alpha-1,2-mannosyltransferase